MDIETITRVKGDCNQNNVRWKWIAKILSNSKELINQIYHNKIRQRGHSH